MISGNNYIGKQIGNYQLTQFLGSGSFGSVYLAHHVHLTNRIGALKIMHSTHLDSDQERGSFLTEAQLLEKLKHPYILQVSDVGIHDGFPYMVAEYASRGSLRDLLQVRPKIEMEGALTLLWQIGQALNFAHQNQIVHRDLKPGNILFNAKGEALLGDFGIAVTLATASIKFVTEASGSPPYMAPEQFKGEVSKKTDQYSLGCIAYELFTGQRPFTAPDPITMGFKHLTEIPVPPRQVNRFLPDYIEYAILRAMAKQSADRFEDVQAFITALRGGSVPTETVDDEATQKNILFGNSEPTAISSLNLATAVSAPMPPPPVPPVPTPTYEYTMPAGPVTPLPSTGAYMPPPNPEQQRVPNPVTPILPPWEAGQFQPGNGGPISNTLAGAGPIGPGVVAAQPPKPKQKRRMWLLIAALLILLLLIVPSVAFAAYYFTHPVTATVTITPKSSDQQSTFTITEITGANPDATQNQVTGARLLTSKKSQTKTGVAATDQRTTDATDAVGSLVVQNFTNGSIYIDTSSITGKSGVAVATDQYYANLPSGYEVTLSAHAVYAGSSGNIPAYDINHTQTITGLTGYVYEFNPSAFYGGYDAGTYNLVKQSDIDNAANPMKGPLTSQAQSDIQSQIHTGEQLYQDVKCKTDVSSTKHAGDQADNFDVTVTATCTAEVYNPQAAQTMAQSLLKSQVQKNLDPNYVLVGDVLTTTGAPKLVDNYGIQLIVNAQGIWVDQFSSSREHTIALSIQGKSVADAHSVLADQVQDVQIILSGGFGTPTALPTDVNNISFVIKAVPGLQASPTPGTGTPATTPTATH